MDMSPELLDQAEKTVHRLEQERADLQIALADPKLYEGEDGDPAAIQKKLGRAGKQLESAEEEWAAAQEEEPRPPPVTGRRPSCRGVGFRVEDLMDRPEGVRAVFVVEPYQPLHVAVGHGVDHRLVFFADLRHVQQR